MKIELESVINEDLSEFSNLGRFQLGDTQRQLSIVEIKFLRSSL